MGSFAILVLSIFTIIQAVIFGGRANFVTEYNLYGYVMAVFLLIMALWGGVFLQHTRRFYRGLSVATIGMLIPLIQLIPLPRLIFSWLPKRNEIYAIYSDFGQHIDYHPISLTPEETLNGAMFYLQGYAIFISVCQLNWVQRKFLCSMVCGFGLLNVLLIILGINISVISSNIMAENEDAFGLFRNANHASVFLCLNVLLFFGIFANKITSTGDKRIAYYFLCFVVFSVYGVGVHLCGSRAGFILFAFAVMLIGLFVVLGGVVNERRLRGLLIAVFLSLGCAAIVLFFEAATFKGFLFDLVRWGYFEDTFRAIVDFFPHGSGIGSFEKIYPMYEPMSSFSDSYIRHAHNDWLEIVLEGGIIAIIALAFGIAWWVKGVIYYWGLVIRSNSQNPGDLPLHCVASIGIGLLFLHSFVDFPLRTGGIIIVFGLLAGLMVEPPMRLVLKNLGR